MRGRRRQAKLLHALGSGSRRRRSSSSKLAWISSGLRGGLEVSDVEGEEDWTVVLRCDLVGGLHGEP